MCPDNKMGEERKQFPTGRYWFCGDERHKIFICEKFPGTRGKNETANIVCEEDASDSTNESIDGLSVEV